MNSSRYFFHFYFLMIVIIELMACADSQGNSRDILANDTVTNDNVIADTSIDSYDTLKREPATSEAMDQTVYPDSVVAFARTLIGIPYLYASTDPHKGFDCSGFITYVFSHFNMTVPRSSVDFTNYGKEITVEGSKPGDLVLFTGTDSTIRIVGQMGIVESRKNDTLHFIHSTSGKAKGVVITPFGNYYKSRFVKVIRIFPDELFK
ncbi:MAG: C40 family peptidase [Chitinophagaceae bacterium]